MMFNVYNIKKLINQEIKVLLKEIYILFFKRKLKQVHKIYKFSDEDLKFAHILEGINYLRIAGNYGNIIPKTVFEFGCHSGRTFINAINSADYLGFSEVEFFAFDSFQGLPETSYQSDGVFKKGSFKTQVKNFIKIIKKKTYYKLPPDNIFQGFYKDTLTKKLQEKLPKVGMVHIDVDLYSSTCEVLNFIKPLLVEGTLILFDDWYCFPVGKEMGEAKAVKEFLEENKYIKFEEWKNYSTFGKSFFVKTLKLNE